MNPQHKPQTEGTVIPPGIVAFRSPQKVMRVEIKDPSQSYYLNKYDEWVRYMQSGNAWSIDTIEVDGIQWSVGDHIHDYVDSIDSFEWEPDRHRWKINLSNINYNNRRFIYSGQLKGVQKLPSLSSPFISNRSAREAAEGMDLSNKYRVRRDPTSNNYNVFEMLSPIFNVKGEQMNSFHGTLSDCFAWIKLKEHGLTF